MQILRDIRQGLLQLNRDSRVEVSVEDKELLNFHNQFIILRNTNKTIGFFLLIFQTTPTFTNVMRMPHQGHWYDEPPYESDPDDFLMSGMRHAGPSATIQGGRVCYTSNGREGQGVISLRSAGDISIPQRGPIRRGLIVPQQPPNPPTIIPLKHARSHDRESGDYAGSISDLHSVTSRLSQVSIGTNNCTARYRTLSGGLGDESPSPSPTPSSEYDDILLQKQLAAAHQHHHHQLQVGDHLLHQNGGSGGSSGIGSQSGQTLRKSIAKLLGFQRNQQNERISRNNRDYSNCLDSINDQTTFQHSASSVESLPSASGSSTQALVRPGSPHSSLSAEDRTTMIPICRAIALIDSNPNPYDKEALRFKKGDIIDVLSMNASGVWRGYANGRLGHFKFISVEVLPDHPVKPYSTGKLLSRNRLPTSCPTSVEELLLRIGLKEYTSVFVLNGYEDLELFKELEPSDLDYLGIGNTEHRAKILAAVQLLHDLDCKYLPVAGSSSENDEGLRHQTSPFGRRHFPRDSGCYEGSPVPSSQQSNHHHLSSDNDTNNLDSVVAQCSNEILKRVEGARRFKTSDGSGNVAKTMNRATKKGGLLGGSGNGGGVVGGGALSEKSSDSGVSSSSLSSGPIKNNL
ncbi:AAEL003199-PA [Aedes aegypti]|uniref:AAEL003199-PA n=1 Tax=Aedes aegypti TaxID=7159 RepID=Q17G54_AEDAE|nr:AAEL003199-PA [Aedes aegypti]